MKQIAFSLILSFFGSCAKPAGIIANEKLILLREIRAEDIKRMKNLEKMSRIYRLRGKENRIALKNFSEEVVSYLDFLIENAPIVRQNLAWFETRKISFNINLSMYLTGGRTIEEREGNERKGLWDVRMYQKRKKNIEARISKKEPLSYNEIKNIQYPLN